MKELRYYQTEAIDAVFSALKRGRKKQMIVLPGGTGKTVICVNVLHKFEGRKLWITHEEELGDQSCIEVLSEMEILPPNEIIDTVNHYGGIKNLLAPNTYAFPTKMLQQRDIISRNVGMIKSDVFDIDKPIVIASAQTLWKRLDRIPKDWFSCIIVDEGDLFGSVTFQMPLNHFAPQLILSATATPFRSDGMLMEDIFEEIVYEYTLQQAFKDGYLTELNAIVVKTNTNLDDVHTSMGDFNQKELTVKVNTLERNNLIVNKYIEYCNGQQFICFAADVQHVIDLHEAFQERGINTAYVVSDKDRMVPGTDRKQITKAFKSGELLGLVNFNIYTAGFDHKDCGCVDEFTEILTPSGWKGINDHFTKVVSYNVKNKKLEYKKVLAKTITEKSESVNYKGACYDINVTTDHRMLIETGRIGSGFYFDTAENDLKNGRRRILVSGNPINKKDISLSDLEIRFIAWFITDGGYVRERTVRISQSKQPTVKIIRDLLNDLGVTYNETVRKNNGFYSDKPIHSFNVAKGVRVKGFEYLRKYLDKKIHKYLLKMSPRQFKVFWDELILGDGWKYKGRGLGVLCTPDEDLVKNIQNLATRCGYFTNAKVVSKLKDGSDFWTITLLNKKYIEIRTFDKRPTKTKKTYIFAKHTTHSPKKFWCIQNENETIITRRNGKIAILGNCVILGCPTKSKRKFLQQLFRVTRLKTAAFVAKFGQIGTILDVVDGTSKHNVINTRELDRGLEIEDRVFISQKNKELLLAARRKREMTVALIKEDKKVQLIPLPTVKLYKTLRTSEAATQLQLDTIKKWGYDTVNATYTKHMISKIFGDQVAHPSAIKKLKEAGYAVNGFVSVSQVQLAEKEIANRKIKQK